MELESGPIATDGGRTSGEKRDGNAANALLKPFDDIRRQNDLLALNGGSQILGMAETHYGRTELFQVQITSPNCVGRERGLSFRGRQGRIDGPSG